MGAHPAHQPDRNLYHLFRHLPLLYEKEGWAHRERILGGRQNRRRAAGHRGLRHLKAGVNGLTKAIAKEGGKYGISCNAVCPSFTKKRP